MTPTEGTRAPVTLLCCDVGPTLGVGHLMRCLALGEELAARGHEVVVAADVATVPWAEAHVHDHGFALTTPPGTPEGWSALVARLDASIVVLDSYQLPRETRRALALAAPVLVAVVDAPGPDDGADLVVDQNFAGDLVPAAGDPAGPGAAARLEGPAYALLRDAVRRARVPSRQRPRRAVPRVECFLGGTDPTSTTAVVVRHLARTGLPFDLGVIAPHEGVRRAVEQVRRGPGQHLRVTGPAPDLARRLAGADLVVSAAGTSVLELLHLGVAVAAVQVADNQGAAYAALTSAGIVAGLGTDDELRSGSTATDLLADLLGDRRLRTAMAALGPTLVDGRGRERVADRALALLADLDRPTTPHRTTPHRTTEVSGRV